MVKPDLCLEDLRARMHPIMNRPAILDTELAELLGVQPKLIRTMITRHRHHLSEEEAFHPTLGAEWNWALTEIGALFLVFRMRTPLTAAISVQMIREVVGIIRPF